MTTTLRVIVDQIVSPIPGGLGRYTEELTRQLIETAPAGCDVAGIVSASPPEKYETIKARLPGLTSLYKTTLPRRELTAAWQLGLSTSPGSGMIHAPGMLAPLRRHDRHNDGLQVALTVHDVLAWTHPEALTPASVAWQKTVLKRARKHADAIVVPTHYVAEKLTELGGLGDRIRVIAGAAGSGVLSTEDADARATRLGLPEKYIATVGTLEPRKGIGALLTGLGHRGDLDLPLVVAGPTSWGEQELVTVAEEAGLAEGRVIGLGHIDDDDLSVVLDRAELFVFPSLEEGFGTPMVEAFRFGTPVVHSDAPALVEVGGDAGLVVEREDTETYPERLAAAVVAVLSDTELSNRLSISSSDRGRAFTWRDSAERVWQLHADL